MEDFPKSGNAAKQKDLIIEDEVKRLTSLLTSLHPAVTINWPLPTLNDAMNKLVKERLIVEGYYLYHSQPDQLRISLTPSKTYRRFMDPNDVPFPKEPVDILALIKILNVGNESKE